MTHEEIMTEIARKELRSYKQLPQIWYQIQTKFRDEPRPKSGLLRVRQFTMKDSYSFDIDAAGLDVSYQKHREAYCRIFDRCGLKYMVVEAHSGAMGGSQSRGIHGAHAGRRRPDRQLRQVSATPRTWRRPTSKLEPVDRPGSRRRWQAAGSPHPGQKTIEDVAKFLGRFAEEQDQDPGATWPKRPTPRRASRGCRAVVVLAARRSPDERDQAVGAQSGGENIVPCWRKRSRAVQFSGWISGAARASNWAEG